MAQQNTISLEDFTNFISEYQSQYEQMELQMKKLKPMALKVGALLTSAGTIFEKYGVTAIEYSETNPEDIFQDSLKPAVTPRIRSSPKAPKWSSKLEASQAKKLWAIDFHQAVGLQLTDPDMIPTQPLDPDALNHLPKTNERMSLAVPAPIVTSPAPKKMSSLRKHRNSESSVESLPSVAEHPTMPERKFSEQLPREIRIMDEVGEVQSVDSLIDVGPSPRLMPSQRYQSSKSIAIDDNSSPAAIPPLPAILSESPTSTAQAETTKITIFSPPTISKPASPTTNVDSNYEPIRISRPEPDSKKRESVAHRIKSSATIAKYHPKGSLASIVEPLEHGAPIHFLRSILENGINPMSAFYVCAQFLISIVYISEMGYIPFEIGFDLEVPVFYSIIVLLVHIFDCFLEFYTKEADFAERNKECTLKDWQKHYLTHRFAIDFITTIPFELIPVDHSAYLWIIKYLRLYKLPRILTTSPIYKRELRRVQKALGIGQAVVLILPLTLIFCYFLHFQACVLFLGGRLANFTNEEIYIYQDASLSRKYAWSLFAAVGNVFQVGYRPSNLYEQWIVVGFIIIGAGMYASVIAAISSLAVSFDASGSLYRQKIDELQEYMNWKGLTRATRQKILKYYDLKYRGKYFEEGSLLNDMNDSLRMEIAAHNCRDLISKVSFLRREQNDGRDELFLGKIASALVPCYFVAGDFLFTQGQPGSEMFFIQHGNVNVLVQGKHVATLNEGSFFGEIALIANIPRTATIQAASSCMLYRLTRIAFTAILDEFEDVKRTVEVIYRQRMDKIKIELEAKKLNVAKDLATKVPFLNRCENDGRDEQFFKMIAASLEPMFLVAGDVVFQFGELGKEMYFVKNGTVDIIVEGVVVSSLKNGAFFGELALIANIPRTASAHAMTTCHLYKLTRDAFIQILCEFKDVRDRIDVIYQERMLKVKREAIKRLESIDVLGRSSSSIGSRDSAQNSNQ
ncbi:cyclic nucleotide-binding-like protein [Obelidium mucronatum]|nr:cyclic nucleotide-binding-like protein [Obelidium mucronatum]